jgi:hypothetical protein
MERVLSRERIAFDQLKLRLIFEPQSQRPGQITVDLDSDHPPGPHKQFIRQRPRTRPDLDGQIVRPEHPRIRHQANQVPINHKILPKPISRLGIGLRENGLDIVLGLSHGGLSDWGLRDW